MKRFVKEYSTDDWVGFYIGGTLVAEGHTTRDCFRDLLKALNVEVVSRYASTDLDDFGNRMPFHEIAIEKHYNSLKQ